VTEYDCQRCGACCVNPQENRAEGFAAYVDVTDADPIAARKDLVRKYVTVGPDGRRHLRMAPDGRCMALRGALGRSVRCDVYHHRPAPCRRVQAGSALCLQYRAGAGL
jgi:Fe-S-cluster containining protein